MLNGHCTEIDVVGEVEEGSAADGPDRHYEFLSLGDNGQIVRVIELRFRAETHDVLDLHPWSDSAAHDIDVCASFGASGAGILKFLVGYDLEKFRVWLYDLDWAGDLIFISTSK